MLVGLLGPQWSGRTSVTEVLAREEGFRVVEDHEDLISSGALMECWKADEKVIVRHLAAKDAGALSRRPFCVFAAVEAPLMQRFRRSGAPDLAQFVQETDDILYGNGDGEEGGLAKWMRQASVRIDNSSTLEQLRMLLVSIDLGNPEHARPSWKTYFIGIAELLVERTNCMVKRSAAVIVKDTRVVSTGYCGTPRGFLNCIEGGCPVCNTSDQQDDPLAQCICICAEESAIIEAGRSRCLDATIYVIDFPCLNCAKKIRQAGILKVIHKRAAPMEPAAIEFFEKTGVEVCQHDFPTSGYGG